MRSAARRLAVRFDEAVWHEAVRGFSREPLQIAASARLAAEGRGIALADVVPCEARGTDGTELAGCAKLYLPLGDAPPSERPLAFVLQLTREADANLVGPSWRSVIATRDLACAACTSGHIASCTADFLIGADEASQTPARGHRAALATALLLRRAAKA